MFQKQVKEGYHRASNCKNTPIMILCKRSLPEQILWGNSSVKVHTGKQLINCYASVVLGEFKFLYSVSSVCLCVALTRQNRDRARPLRHRIRPTAGHLAVTHHIPPGEF